MRRHEFAMLLLSADEYAPAQLLENADLRKSRESQMRVCSNVNQGPARSQTGECFMANRTTTTMVNRSNSHQVHTGSQSNNLAQAEAQVAIERDESISVVIIDSSKMTAELLTRALSRVKTLNILKSVVNLREAVEAIASLTPDVAVVSTNLADGPFRGFELLRQARSLSSATQCVVLMDDSDHELVVDAFRAGARGVFKRSGSMRLLGRCISAINAGQVWASSTDLQQVLEALERTLPFRCVNSRGDILLTRREQEIVPLVAQGLTNKEISSNLKLSEHTIKNHLFRIYEKLGISSRVELILYAVSEREVR
jgi:DNA-binding NarL/FixJ family response regulator